MRRHANTETGQKLLMIAMNEHQEDYRLPTRAGCWRDTLKDKHVENLAFR